MKNSFKTLAAILIAASLFQSCKDDETTFEIALENIDACVPGNVYQNYHEEWTTIDQNTIEALFSQNGIEFNFSDIKDVTLHEAKVDLVSPTGGNLADIRYVDIYFRQIGATDPGTKVAYITTISDNAVTITLDNQYADLDPFFNLPQFEAGFRIFREAIGTEVCVKGTLKLNVKVSTD